MLRATPSANSHKVLWDGLTDFQRIRKEEIDEFHKHEVYTKTELSECWKETGKAPVKVRWIDINKGDSENPDYRSRLVAK